MRKALVLVAGNLAGIVLLTALAEGGLALLYRFPPRRPAVLRAAREYHRQYERKNVHFLKECSRHDPRVSYLLQEGSCTFESREFRVAITGNRLGIRDDDASLEAPEIIAAGDSQTFGWGVEAADAFPQRLERETGVKTLSLAMPSFGTAREMILLGQVDRSRLRLLLVQYSDNDIEENRQFEHLGDRLKIMRPQDYAFLRRRHHSRELEYFPGKFSLRFWPLLYASVMHPPPVPSAEERQRKSDREAELFLNALLSLRPQLAGVPILVFEINSYGANDSEFVTSVARLAAAGEAAGLDLHVVDLSQHLGAEHYYLWDDHMRPEGHRVVTEALLEAIRTQDLLGRRNVPAPGSAGPPAT